MLSTLKRYPLPPNVTPSLSIRRSLPKVKTKKKKNPKKSILFVCTIYICHGILHIRAFLRSRRATPLPLKKITTFFCLSYALLPILKSTKLFGSKEKNTNLLLNSNDLQQRKKKERTVKCTFSSPPNHAIVAYTPFYKGCDVAFTKYPPAIPTRPPSTQKIKESAF